MDHAYSLEPYNDSQITNAHIHTKFDIILKHVVLNNINFSFIKKEIHLFDMLKYVRN